ncbi:MAG TPA: AI-2E family transporter, partial [Chitinophagaceae bacterium]|nr:AI-2E family transporter [Chitinophagaceae bacterium]
MPAISPDTLYKTLIKVISYTAGVIILLWFLYKTSAVVLLLLFAMILALVINAPVVLLEKRGIRRFWAALIVFGIILTVLLLLGWLIVPKISDQVSALVTNLPDYANQLSNNVAS